MLVAPDGSPLQSKKPRKFICRYAVCAFVCDRSNTQPDDDLETIGKVLVDAPADDPDISDENVLKLCEDQLRKHLIMSAPRNVYRFVAWAAVELQNSIELPDLDVLIGAFAVTFYFGQTSPVIKPTLWLPPSGGLIV